MSHGRAGIERTAGWRIAATLGAGCDATFFVWVQHHTTVRLVRDSADAAFVGSALPQLSAGRQRTGVAFAHLRRPGPPAILATKVAGGWRFDSFTPWTTSWGSPTGSRSAASPDDGELVWAILTPDHRKGVTAVPLALPVRMSTGTVSLRFDGWFVPDERIFFTGPGNDWRHSDRHLAALGYPVPLGIVERCTVLLAEIGATDLLALDASRRSTEEHQYGAARLDDVVGCVADDGFVTVAAEHRAACLHLAARAAAGLLAAAGGLSCRIGRAGARHWRDG